jgi:hypothetical protein
MGAGTATYSDISSVVNDIQQDSMAVARMANLLIPTVTGFGGAGMNPRVEYQWNSVAFATHTEEVDEASTDFSKTLLATLTPANYHARVDLTDERIASDWENVRAGASLELGSGAAKHIDTKLATLFGTASALGGTIGPANAGTAVDGTITWRSITKGLALLQNLNIPAGAPVFCAIHPYQWEVLLAANSIAAATVSVAPGFQDRMSSSGGFFTIPQFVGITFLVTNSIVIAATAAYGAIYTPQAFALDTRKLFSIEPQRDASKQAWELNASMWYGYGVLDPNKAVLLRHHCLAPS